MTDEQFGEKYTTYGTIVLSNGKTLSGLFTATDDYLSGEEVKLGFIRVYKYNILYAVRANLTYIAEAKKEVVDPDNPPIVKIA